MAKKTARKCKHGKLKTPYRDANGKMHYCKKKKKKKKK